ncbi:MAG: hypothetical protein E2O46_03415 [Ignavibacteria bacterium]|nr:MAG: hypothetical protein E2O46_03415 [Ignavibacteria bacterium]
MKLPKKILLFGISFGIISLLILAGYTLFATSNQTISKSILIGDFLAFLNFILGLLFVSWGLSRPNKEFLASLFGGLLIRLSLLLILLTSTLIFLEINEISFIFSILFFYFFYVIIEIIYLNFRER